MLRLFPSAAGVGAAYLAALIFFFRPRLKSGSGSCTAGRKGFLSFFDFISVLACNAVSNRADGSVHGVFPIECFVDGVRAVEDGVAGAEGEVFVDHHGKFAESVCDYKISFLVHGFLRIVRGSLAFAPNNSENALMRLARSNYRKASIPHAPQGAAVRLRTGRGNACA